MFVKVILPWLTVGVLAVVVAIVIALLVRESRRRRAELARRLAEEEAHRADIERFNAERAALQDELAAERREAEHRSTLYALIDQAHRAQEGRIGLFAFDRDTSRPLLGVTADEGLVAAITRDGERELLNALIHADPLAEPIPHLAVSSALDNDNRVFAVADVTDRDRIPGLLAANRALEEQYARSDRLTDALNLEAFLELAPAFRKANADRGVELVLVSTALADTAAHTGSRETYIRACARALMEALPDGLVARYSEHALCCLLPEPVADRLVAVASRLLQLHTILCTVDETQSDGSILVHAPFDGEHPAQLLHCLSIRAAQARMEGKQGLLPFDPAESDAILSRETDLRRIIDRQQLRFLYRPIATGADARVFGYELTPYFTNEAYDRADDLLASARLYGLAEPLWRLILTEALRQYGKDIRDGRILSSTHIWLRSPTGVCLGRDAAQALHEAQYDNLKQLILELPEPMPAALASATLKRERLARWDASCAVPCTGQGEEDLLKLALLRPAVIRLPITALQSAKSKAASKELLSRQKKLGARLLVDGITTAAEMETAIAAGATLLAGDYIGIPESDPGELAYRGMKRIAHIQYGKRG